MISNLFQRKPRKDELLQAARGGDMHRLQRCLSAGLDANCNHLKDGSTPLHLAAKGGHLEVVSKLLAARAHADATDNVNCTPLHYAACLEDTAVMLKLLKGGARIDAADLDGCTPLHWAACSGRVESAAKLLAAGARKCAPNRAGWTPLHLAAYTGHRAVVMKLLGAGAPIDAVTKDGWTPLSIALENRDLELVSRLLVAGASADVCIDVAPELAALPRCYHAPTAQQVPAGGGRAGRRRSVTALASILASQHAE